MLRKLGAVAIAATLFVNAVPTLAAAETASDQPALTAGKPAGVEEARRYRPVWFWVGGVLVLGLAIGLIASSDNNGSAGFTTGATHP